MDDVERSPVTEAVVGLDLSLSATGVCVKSGSVLTVETIKTDPRTCPNDLVRLRHISNEVLKRIPSYTKMICIEDIFMPCQAARIGQAMNLAKLAAVVRLAVLEGGFPFFIINDMQLKKFACGKGQGVQKGIIIREVYRKWGVEVKDDNQADATVLAYMAETILAEDRSDLTAYQTEVIEKVIKERPRYNV